MRQFFECKLLKFIYYTLLGLVFAMACGKRHYEELRPTVPEDSEPPTAPHVESEDGVIDSQTPSRERAEEEKVDPKEPVALPIIQDGDSGEVSTGVLEPKQASVIPLMSAQNTYAKKQGMLFTSIDMNYRVSELHYLDFTERTLSLVSSGESGDPLLIANQDLFVLFNRTPGNTNYRIIKRNNADFVLSLQKSHALLTAYDPHDATILDKTHIALSMYTAHKIVIIDIENQTVTEPSFGTLDFGVGTNIKFRPEQGTSYTMGGKTFFAVAHQGWDNDDVNRLNGSQTLFIFSWQDGQLTPVDVDASLSGIQGIPLASTFPSKLVWDSEGKLIVLGLCTDPSGEFYPEDMKSCSAAIDVINMEKYEINRSFSIKKFPFSANPYSIVVDPDKLDFYTVQLRGNIGQLASSFNVAMVHLDVLSGEETQKILYEFPGDLAPYFFPNFNVDLNSGNLFVGERLSNGKSYLKIVEDGKLSTTIETRLTFFGSSLIQ